MNLALSIARRYLFAKKTTNTINIITGISVLGVAIGTAALILVLSVFNGFEGLLSSMLNRFNPDLKISLKEGKFFEVDSSTLAQVASLDGVLEVSKSIEEIAIFEYGKTQDIGVIKGVDEAFDKVTMVDSTIVRGDYLLKDEHLNYGVVGLGLYSRLGISPIDKLTPIKVYMAKQKKTSALEKEFRTMSLYPSGSFSVQGESDYTHIIAPFEFASKLLGIKNKVSQLEIKLASSKDESEVVEDLSTLLGDRFIVKNRYQQDEAFLKLMNIEKWVSYLIISLTLLLVAFNIIGALWMLVLDKKKDIAILKSLGSTREQIRNLYLYEGVIICALGLVLGIVLTFIIYFLQTNFGMIGIPQGFIIDAYPIELKWTDFVIVSITVMIIGTLASWYPAVMASKLNVSIRANE